MSGRCCACSYPKGHCTLKASRVYDLTAWENRCLLFMQRSLLLSASCLAQCMGERKLPSCRKRWLFLQRFCLVAVKQPSGVKSFPSPKRGVLRCVLRKPARSVKKPKRDDVPYVPVEQQLDRKSKAELRHQTWCCSLIDLVQWTERKLITFLLSVGVLWKFNVCPHCRAGKISKLFHRKDRGWTYCCKASRCHKFVLPHAERPFSTCGWGRSVVLLRQQVQVLFCNVARIDSGKTHIITGLGPKIVQSLSKRWRKALISYVEKRQDSTPFGNLKSCVQYEVAVRGKRKGSKVIWRQYLGPRNTGARESQESSACEAETQDFILYKGNGVVSPPGPISKQEWKSIGRRY